MAYRPVKLLLIKSVKFKQIRPEDENIMNRLKAIDKQA